jgi:hypothetical protein
MILKAEPDKALRFLEDNFALFRTLYRLQLEHSIIGRDLFEEATEEKADVIVKRMLDYKLVVSQPNGFRINEPVRGFLAFLLNEFKPLLPEELTKYRQAFLELFKRIQAFRDDDILILAERLDAFYQELQEFLENVESNTSQLLRNSQYLKANKGEIPYSERVRRARHLIEYYIEPLNRILDVQKKQSITNLLNQVSAYVNVERFNHPHTGIRQRFERLHELLREAEARILRQSHVVTRELLPLIERLQTESEILSGWLYFLERPFLHEVPVMPARRLFTLTGSNIGVGLELFLQQFERRPADIVLKEEETAPVNTRQVYFNRRHYQQALKAAAPVGNYFEWCYEAMQAHEAMPTTERFLKIGSLLFEEADEYEAEFGEGRIQLQIESAVFDLPVMEVRRKAQETGAQKSTAL